MIPVPAAVREPQPRYIQVHSAFAKQIRKTFLLMGIASILSGPVLGLTALVWGFQMLVTDHVFIMTGAMHVACAALLMRSHLSADHVNISSVRFARNMLVVAGLRTLWPRAYG